MHRNLLTLFYFVCIPTYGFDHSAWTQILSNSVQNASVDYRIVQQNASQLDAYLGHLESISLNEFEGWNTQAQIAFLINAYNAFTLKLISDFYPDISSIRDIGSKLSTTFFQKINFWKKGSRQWDITSYTYKNKTVTFSLLGKPRSLNEIEHTWLRKKHTEPRVHFALVCAAKSCPKLQPVAYLEKTLDSQLTSAGKAFLANPLKNTYNAKTHTLHVSMIFKWFKEDFTQKGALFDFLKLYLSALHIQTIMKSAIKPKIKYLPYDWSLNQVP